MEKGEKIIQLVNTNTWLRLDTIQWRLEEKDKPLNGLQVMYWHQNREALMQKKYWLFFCEAIKYELELHQAHGHRLEELLEIEKKFNRLRIKHVKQTKRLKLCYVALCTAFLSLLCLVSYLLGAL